MRFDASRSPRFAAAKCLTSILFFLSATTLWGVGSVGLKLDTISAHSTPIVPRGQPFATTPEQFVRRGYHASAVLNGWLYIEGGDYTFWEHENDLIHRPQLSTLALDLSFGWSSDNAPLNILEVQKPEKCHSLNIGSIWLNSIDGALYSGFTGEMSSGSSDEDIQKFTLENYLCTFTPDGRGNGVWSTTMDFVGTDFRSLHRPSGGLTAFSNESAYYLGGISNRFTSPELSTLSASETRPLPGMLEFNFESGRWRNLSSAAYSAQGLAAFGQMVHVPGFGPKGIFVMLGGASEGLTEYDVNAKFQPFDGITIFEPSTQSWFRQEATGDVPEPRIDFCATVTQAAGAATYEIYVYGGWNGTLGPKTVRFDEAFVLSLPAFHWTKINYPAQFPRYGHTCHTVGTQMLVVGGLDPTQSNRAMVWKSKDNFGQGFGVLDLSTQAWTNAYNEKSGTYQIAETIQEYYRNNPRFPSTWAHPKLAELMGSSTPRPSVSPTPSPSSTSGPPNHVDTALIVGGSIGGVAAIGLIVVTIWLLLKRAKGSDYPAQTMTPLEPVHEIEATASSVSYIGQLDGRAVQICSELPGSEIR
ncbi:MAG: hypothetical protein M1837_004895 [Sclerophora amabilis]|nr:MAG: hypothetical protein M1837_004895 [Sclerophora amabilis]